MDTGDLEDVTVSVSWHRSLAVVV